MMINNSGYEVADMTLWFEEVTRDARRVQTQTLARIIRQNSRTEYLKRWLGKKTMDMEFEGVEDDALEECFTSSVPVSTHSDYEDYIQRIADGNSEPILTQEPITTLSLSSGTTEGRPKYLPFTKHSAQSTVHMFRLAEAYRSRVFPIEAGGRILEFIYSGRQSKTRGGLKLGTATTHYFESEEFKVKQKETKAFTCSPVEVISCPNHKESTYCHLLLGLFFSQSIEFIASTFAYSIVEAFGELECLWREICGDIKDGVLSSRISLEPVRKAVLDQLRPNPELASVVERKCREMEAMDWHGVIPALWPNAKYIYSIMTGSMLPYLKKLRRYAGGLPLVGADYGATECWIGVNVDPAAPPERVSFTLVPTFAYFEFIPLTRRREDGNGRHGAVDQFVETQPVRLSQLMVGEEYEVVVTTFTGLYRYKLGDVVQVAGFYNGSPKLTFVCRRKLTLTVNIDKNTERDVQLAVENGAQLLNRSGIELEDFTSTVDLSTSPGHYVIYWELSGDLTDGGILNECCKRMDESFVDYGYVVSRKAQTIGPLELCIVGKGTFKKILDHFVKDGPSLSQFKTPRCTNNQDFLEILDNSSIERFRSTAYSENHELQH